MDRHGSWWIIVDCATTQLIGRKPSLLGLVRLRGPESGRLGRFGTTDRGGAERESNHLMA
jgi:hypothetical protein